MHSVEKISYIAVYMTSQRLPNFVKFSYKHRERLCVKAKKLEGDSFIGTIANDPVTTAKLKFVQNVKIKESNVVDVQW